MYRPKSIIWPWQIGRGVDEARRSSADRMKHDGQDKKGPETDQGRTVQATRRWHVPGPSSTTRQPLGVHPSKLSSRSLLETGSRIRWGVAEGTYEKLSIIIPVFNERNTVVEAIRQARSVDIPLKREIIVVDDGSDDGTGQILSQLQDSTVRVIRHPENRGKGAAIRTGLNYVTGDLVLIQDADLEYDPEDWPSLLAPVLKGKARVVYGSRFTGERRNMMFWHWVGNRFLSLVTNALYNTTLSDMETCSKLFDRKLMASLPLRSDGFGFEPEVTAMTLRTGERIYEVPISYAGREADEGKKITWRDGLGALAVLVRCRFGPGPRR
jgi:hypothetical protein